MRIHTTYRSFIRAYESADLAPMPQNANYDWDGIKRKVNGVRMWLSLNKGSWATLLSHLPINGSFDHGETMCTNGREIIYHPDFVLTQSPKALAFVFVHEVLHCIFLHHKRIEGRDPELWNIACDYAINPILDGEEGFEWPVDESGKRIGLLEPKYVGWSAEAIYDDLLADPNVSQMAKLREMIKDMPGNVINPNKRTKTIPQLTESSSEEEQGQGEGQAEEGQSQGKEGQGKEGNQGGEKKSSGDLPSVGSRVRLQDGSEAVIKKVYPNGDIEI